jgi:hypothetical protein
MSRTLDWRIFSSGKTDLSKTGFAASMFFGYLGLNLFGWWLARVLAFDRPLFNLDYLLVGLVYLWISRTLAALLLVALVPLAYTRYLIPTYFFSRQSFSVLFWVREMANWSPAIQLVMVAGSVATFTLLVMVFRRYLPSLRVKLAATAWIAGLGVLLIAVDVLNGTNSFIPSSREASFYPGNIAGSPLYLVMKETCDTIRGAPARYTPIKSSESATGRYFSESLSSSGVPDSLEKGLATFSTINPGELPDKIVLIVFESLSVLASDPGLKSWQEPFKSVENRYTVESGTFGWSGATFRGEVRELCWQSRDGVQFGPLPPALPAVLKNLHYESCSFHGFYKTMYDRDRYYPMMGFDRSIFLNEMKENNEVPLAGTLFHGATDSYVASLVHRQILKPGKQFVYWLTLSSHIPINVPFAKQIASPEELAGADNLPAAIWGYSVICRKTLDSIAEIAADESLTNCDFIIVGDHQLPLSSAKLRPYIVSRQIPYLILRWKKPATSS